MLFLTNQVKKSVTGVKPKIYSKMTSKYQVVITDKKVTSKELFAKNNELIIEHDDQQYRLRITANGKLILTK